MAWVMRFSATILGKPEPAGSKRAVSGVIPGKFTAKGKQRTWARAVDDNPKSTGWKNRVAQAVSDRYRGPILLGALMVRFTFFRPRPAGHYSKRFPGKLVGSAPEFPLPKPDVLKLARAVEDALTAVIWKDDAQIVSEVIHKRFANRAAVRLEILEWKA